MMLSIFLISLKKKKKSEEQAVIKKTQQSCKYKARYQCAAPIMATRAPQLPAHSFITLTTARNN